MPSSTRRSRSLIAALVALVTLTLVAVGLGPPPARPTGLVPAFRGAGGATPSLVSRRPTGLPSTQSLRDTFPRELRTPFSAAWTGWLVVDASGTHRFAIFSDGRVSLWLDDRPVVTADSGTQTKTTTADASLSRGLHRMRVEYDHPGGDVTLHLAWQRPGRPWEALVGLEPHLRPAATSWREYRTDQLRRWLLLLVPAVWVAVLLASLACIVSMLVRRAGATPERLLLVLAFGLCVWGIDWGLPAAYGWAPDEVVPARLLEGMRARFVGGWHDLYPPLQFYLLAWCTWPVVLGEALGWYRMNELPPLTVAYVTMRAVSVLMAVGVVMFVYLMAREVLDVRRARLGASLGLLSLPFLYYAKTANVDMPCLFWVSASLWFYVRYLRYNRRWDCLLLAATATAAVCTKDHAYGFYVLMPLALVASNIWHRRRRNDDSPWRRGTLDPTWLLAVGVSATVFMLVYLLPVNLDGLQAHLAAVRRGKYPPMVESSLGGQARLVLMTLGQLAWSAGWPAFILALGGVLRAVWRRTNPAMLALLVPALSYHLTFISFIQYSYDRFLLGTWLILAIFGGDLAGALVEGGRRFAHVGRWVVGGIAAYSLVYAVTINAMMGLDRRYGVERYLREHAPPFADVYTVVPGDSGDHLPRLDAYRHFRLNVAIDGLAEDRPHFILFDELRRGRLEAWPNGAALLADLDAGRLGYLKVVSGRTPLPWWALARRTRWLSAEREEGRSNLEKINPPIALYRRGPG